MKKIFSFVLAVMMLCLCFTSCGANRVYHAEMEIENYGVVCLELDGTVAPITVKNFVKLAKSGFYDGLPITRIQQGFVLQGGQSDVELKPIKGEFASNGVYNSISHKKGVISMARTTEPDSATSQFFIMLADNTDLDGNYAAFGWVTSGMEVIEAICADMTSASYLNDYYYGTRMGFLKNEAMPIIKTVRIVD